MAPKPTISNDKLKVAAFMDIITTADIGSIRHSVYASPQSLAVAAEAMLGYLFREAKLDHPLASPTRKLVWLQRSKRQKHVATEGPTWVSDLLNALLWVIPKVGFSEKKICFIQNIHSRRVSMRAIPALFVASTNTWTSTPRECKTKS